eukprot:scaffold242579_cov40-Tisochrysis_lutea.AAC.1
MIATLSLPTMLITALTIANRLGAAELSEPYPIAPSAFRPERALLALPLAQRRQNARAAGRRALHRLLEASRL